MNTTASPLSYRPPQGRPRAIPPCDTRGPVVNLTNPRPVRELGESSGHYGARVRHWLEGQDPERKAARIAKMKATQRKLFLRRKRKEAAAKAIEETAARWYTPAEVQAITGWSPKYIRKLAADWPRRPSQRPDRFSRRDTEMFGDPATLIGRRPPPAFRAPPEPMTAVVSVASDPVPRPSLWQRIKRWFA